MAGRIRSIKPEILDDEIAAGLSDTAWRIWVSSWVLADDFANFRAGAKYLAAQVWQDTNRVPDAILGLEELRRAISPTSKLPLVFCYVVNGQRYAHIKGFPKHQRQDNASRRPRVPAPSESDSEWFPELTIELAARMIESRRDSFSRGESHPFAAYTSDLRPPITYHLPPSVPPDAFASAATEPRDPPAKDFEPAELTDQERAVLTAIVDDESLRPIVRAPGRLARDLLRVAPGIDVPTTLRKAGAWLRANPTKRKSNGAKFLLNWLTREQDSRGGRGVPPSGPRPGPARAVQPAAAVEFKPGRVIE